MKHTNSKFFIMFLAGILFSAITVFAATVNVSTNFVSNATQYLQQLVLTDAGGTTGIVLDGSGNAVHTDYICNTDGGGCKTTANLFEGTDTTLSESEVDAFVANNGYITVDTNTQLSESEVDAFVSNNGYLTSELWRALTNDNIYYTSGTVGIGRAPSSSYSLSLQSGLYIYADSSVSENAIYANGGNIFLRNGDISFYGRTGHRTIMIYEPMCRQGENVEGTSLEILGGNSCGSTDQDGGDITLNGGSRRLGGSDGNIILGTNDGFVGVGTETPTAKLDVAGTGKFDNIISESSIKLGFKLTCDATTRGSIRYKEGNGNEGSCNDSIELCVFSSGAYDWIQIVSAADTPDGSSCQTSTTPEM